MSTRAKLVKKRDLIIAHLTRSKSFLKGYDAATQQHLVSTKLNFDQEQQREDMMRRFEDLYYEVRAGLLARMPKVVAPSSGSNDGAPKVHAGVHLPKIELPKFNGDYDLWLPFHDTFKSLIHDNPDLKTIQKFHYLRSCVVEEAERKIENLQLSEINYCVGYSCQTVLQVSSNKYLNKKRHVNALLHFPRAEKLTASGIHEVIDCFDRCTKILDQLGEVSSGWGVLLTQLLVSKMDDASQKSWEEAALKLADPTFGDVIQFLENQTRVLEAIAVDQQPEVQRSSPVTSGKPAKKPFPKLVVNAATDAGPQKCPVCKGSHQASYCPDFKRLSVEQRIKTIYEQKLCKNCLRVGHRMWTCPIAARCSTCGGRHHSLIHPEKPAGVRGSASNRPAPVVQQAAGSSVPSAGTGTASTPQALTSSVATIYAANVAAESRKIHVFLSTVLVSVKDCNGKLHTARALLDSGSQANLISERLCQMLRLPRKKVSVPISGVGSARMQVDSSASAIISSRVSNYTVPMEFLVLKRVTEDQPSATIAIGWNLPSDMVLADPGFNKRAPIDLLLGLEHFYEFLLLNGGQVQIQRPGEGLPLFVNTVFGWIAAGKTDLGSLNPVPSCHVSVNATLEEKIERFWTIEELQEAPKRTQEEQDCEEHFQTTFSRDTTGRYVVRLPKRLGFEKMIGESRDMAVRRLMQLERRLGKDEGLRVRYSEAIHTYLEQDHMRLVSEEELKGDTRLECYLPHHPVFKESSTTTKIRPVFDGSAKTTSNHSLNEALMVGPVLQDPLFDLVLRFRKKQVALVADIEKMYLQVKVHSDDTPLQRILWRPSPSEPIRTYEMLRVTFGLAPSSYLATRCLQQLAHDEGEVYQRAREALLRDFYVDDFIGGAESEEEALLLRQELEQLLLKGGFRLRKWVSNATGALAGLAADDLGTQTKLNFDQEQVKTLGINWQPGPDVLGIDVSSLSVSGPWTRRRVYSIIAQLWDPSGITAPVISWAKIRMQLLWVATQGWDDPLAPALATQWTEFHQQLPELAKIAVDRCAFVENPAHVEFHVFADASEAAYGACIYVRSVDPSGRVKICLLAAKSRPAGLKKVTLARLELCAALMAARLYSRVVQALKMEGTETWFWSDSTVVLAWLKSPSYVWPTFVANRVSHIQELTKGHRWNHVKGTENPADLVSRGVMPKDLVGLRLWFQGPHWLEAFEEYWSKAKHEETEDPAEELLEKKKNILVVSESPEPHPLIDRYACYWKLLRITAYCMRFARNCQRRKKPSTTSYLTVGELKEAKLALVRSVQQEPFATEIKALANHRLVPAHSSLKLLNPFLDQQGVLRVGGRLRLAGESFSTRHPMILPNSHTFTRQVAVAYHAISLHSGPRMTLAQVRQEFWPLSGKQLATYTYRNCVRCFRSNPVPVKQPPGQLPKPRTTPSRPFTVTGVDYCGPVYLKPAHRRAAALKAYIAVFVCFSTKAVHLELVGDLTTAAFLAALRRFVARRGLPSEVHSDNGLNFQGASNHLRELYDLLQDPTVIEEVTNEATRRGIDWKFIPPRAPNFGGLWEAAVKSAKTSLIRVLGQRQLSFEDMITVLAQIEAAMNSRPLTPLSEDPDELDVLTPGHFLTGTSLLAIPDPDYSDIPTNRLQHYQQLQQLVQQHWKRWRREYISQLHNQNQKFPQAIQLKAGQMVVLKEDNKAAIEWPLARIVEVYPGPDGVVRVVKLRLPNGAVYKRQASRVCLLPFERDSIGQTSNAFNPQPSQGAP
ncbi:uncharacterized protein LOC120432183 [Culex pipiens pallens]|uniref:uncharacterized protein LOC120432183 n=1 Tax=Culex pipiens pallens TaxID=42434 RepID=UPI001953AF3F|nr:uncharacterized protein LOC120432183 [Culex pipiens pallens]